MECHSQQYYVVTGYDTEEIFPNPICALHFETVRQFVASVFGVLCSVGGVTIATCNQ